MATSLRLNQPVSPLRGKVVLVKNYKSLLGRITERSFTSAFIRGWIHSCSLFFKLHVDVICHTRSILSGHVYHGANLPSLGNGGTIADLF